jgi:hypothetical protein
MTLAQEFFPNQETNSRTGFRRETSVMNGHGIDVDSEFIIPYFTSVSEITERITSAGILQTESRSGVSEWGYLKSLDGIDLELTQLGNFKNYGSASIHSVGSQKLLLRHEAQNELWYSIQAPDDPQWFEQKLLIDSLQGGGFYLTRSENNRLHLCWMDMRLKKGAGFFIFGDWDVGRKNNQVFYRNYDENKKWSKEKKLSGSYSYCEKPSMSVEGQNIVVVWHHYPRPYTRAALYNATSRDKGKSWSRARKIDTHYNDSTEAPKMVLREGISTFFMTELLDQTAAVN